MFDLEYGLIVSDSSYNPLTYIFILIFFFNLLGLLLKNTGVIMCGDHVKSPPFVG